MRLHLLGPTGRSLQLACSRNGFDGIGTRAVRPYASSSQVSQQKKDEDEDPWAGQKLPYQGGTKRASLDDFPVPHGSWREDFHKKQRKFNIQLGLGMAFLGGTLFYIWYADPFKVKFLFAPRKFMKNPPAFYSPVMEPRFDADLQPQVIQTAENIVLIKSPEQALSASKPAKLDKSLSAAAPVAAAFTSKHAREDVPLKKPKTLVTAGQEPKIPNHVPYLIIGGGTAAFSAFRAIRANDPTAVVLVVTEDSHNPYMRPPLTKELWASDDSQKDSLRFKQMSGKERSIFFEHEEFFVDPKMLCLTENGGVGILKNSRVTKLNPVEQKVTLQNGSVIHYDRCLLATGASPKPLAELNKSGGDLSSHVTLYRGIDSFKELNTAIKTSKKVLVIGGGFLGSELACSLARQGKDTGLQVMQIYPEKGNLGRLLPGYLSEWLTRKLRIIDGVRVYPERHVKSAKLTKDGVVVILSDDEEITADHVVVAIGVTPNTELASKSGLAIDEVNGGFWVNAELEAKHNLWVAGDAASFFDGTLGRRRIEHHDHAIATGRTAGENMSGKGKSFSHQSMFWSDIGPEVGLEAVGLIDSSLDTVAVFARPEPGLWSSSEEAGLRKTESDNSSLKAASPKDDYRRGVVFYLKDRIIVCVLLWNIFSHMALARKVVKDQKTFDDLGELAKLFTLHDEELIVEDNADEATRKLNVSQSVAA